MNNEILVSVSMVTYKHEAYIREAIEGVLMQETDFEYDLIVADDCSPDKTPEIVAEIIANHPKGYKIKYFRHSENIGMQPNGIFAGQQCTGKYFAICEGDDYWTDPLKLQKQVDFLEANEEYILCFHDASYLFQNGTEKKFSEKYSFLNSKKDYTRGDLFQYKWFIPTASVLFKNMPMLSNYLRDVFSGDSTLHLLLSRYGKFRYLPDCMSIYRVTGNGVSTIINKPEYRIHDLKKWMHLVEPHEKKFLYKQMFGNYKLLLISNIKNKKVLSVFQNTKNMSITLLSYFYYSSIYRFYTKKTSF